MSIESEKKRLIDLLTEQKLQKRSARQSGNALNRPIAEITENPFTASFLVDRFSPEHAPDRIR